MKGFLISVIAMLHALPAIAQTEGALMRCETVKSCNVGFSCENEAKFLDIVIIFGTPNAMFLVEKDLLRKLLSSDTHDKSYFWSDSGTDNRIKIDQGKGLWVRTSEPNAETGLKYPKVEVKFLECRFPN